jgi:hypothetical protein
MSHYPFGACQTLRVLTGLDFGLRVHVQVRPGQRAIFATVHNPSVRQLTTELVELVSSLRVYRYALRGQLEVRALLRRRHDRQDAGGDADRAASRERAAHRPSDRGSSASAADTGNLFRYTGGQYVFILDTRGLTRRPTG